MVRIPKFTLRREQLERVKIKIIRWGGAIAIILGMVVLYEMYELNDVRQQAKSTDVQNMKKMLELQDKLVKAQESQIKKEEDIRLREDKIKADATTTQKRMYQEKVAEAILGTYGTYGMKKGLSERRIIYDTVNRVFNDMEIMFQKKLIDKFAPNIRLASLQVLGEFQQETNFSLDSVEMNYVRDWSKHVVLFNLDDKARIEQLGFPDKYIYGPTKVEFVYGKRKEYAKPIGGINKILINESDVGEAMIDGKKQKVNARAYAIKTSIDYGGLQVNCIHIRMGGYDVLRKKGVWDPTSNKWILDPDVNIFARVLLADEPGAANGWDKPGDGWNDTFLQTLLRVDGWQNVYQ